MKTPPDDLWVKKRQFTRTVYRDVYPAIDPRDHSNSQARKTIVITGASRGIGRKAFVHSFSKANPKGMVIVARSANALEEVRDEIHTINKDIQVLIVPTDLLSAESIAALWAKVKETFGHVDVLINNAGSLQAGLISDLPVERWWVDFETNVRAAFLLTQGFAALLGKERKGNIVSVASATAAVVFAGMSSYSLSKLAAIQLQAFVAAEYPNITAVAHHPGIVLTDMTPDYFRLFAKDTSALVGGVGVWPSTEKSSFLDGKYIESVDELSDRRDGIVQ